MFSNLKYNCSTLYCTLAKKVVIIYIQVKSFNKCEELLRNENLLAIQLYDDPNISTSRYSNNLNKHFKNSVVPEIRTQDTNT